MTKIIGKNEKTAAEMAAFLMTKNASPKLSRTITIKDFCQIWIDVCAKEGVRGDIAFAQACKETGYFTFNGDVKYTQNNFAGLGATGGVPGCSFSSIEEGILAQAQHLKTYATKDALNEKCVDPRRTDWFVSVKGGTSPDVETLGGTWAVPGYDAKKYASLQAANLAKDSYGYQIINILNQMKPEVNKSMAYSNSSMVTYTKISPNKTVCTNRTIDTITIHHMAGNLSVETCGNVFQNPAKKGSSNYGINGKNVGLYVEEKDRAWTSSNKTNDMRAVTIEVANDQAGVNNKTWTVSDESLNTLIKLVADICKRNNIKKLVWDNNKTNRVNHVNGCNMTVHRDFSATACPGDYLYSKMSYIADEVNRILGNPVAPTPVPTTTYTHTQFVKDVQKAIGAGVDGIAGPETLSKTVTVSKTKNARHAVVKPIQKYLNSLGYNCGTADGIAGTLFDTAVKKYQKDHGCTADGEITAKMLTWKKLLGLA